ncbi:AraC family transcriptional regulator [Marinomonas sp. THO17]|uniref:AraC family transcriptional regulator n=1 Tax=Marinomonas sp. THO17 TaxID=3149048 RepID=UPI00336BDEC9
MMILILLVILSLLAGSLIYTKLFSGRFFKRHHLLVESAQEDLIEHLQDLSNWTDWLPWLLFDKSAKITFEYANPLSPLASCLVWQGKLIQSGCVYLEASRHNAPYFHCLIEAPAFYPSDLHFNIDVTKQKQGTLISFQVTGKLPFWRRWQQADYAIRADKDAELAMLLLHQHLQQSTLSTSFAEQVKPSSEVMTQPIFDFLGTTQLTNLDAVTRPFTVNHQPMSQKMDQGFHELITALGPENPPAGPSFALYRQVDLAHHVFTGRLGIPVQNMVPCELCPERITLKGNYLTLRYTGRYQFLSVAWHVLYSYMRLSKIKPRRHHEGLEIFETGPNQADQPKDYVTKICLPVKS